MDSNFAEADIKIEYIGYNDRDPLSDVNVMSPTSYSVLNFVTHGEPQPFLKEVTSCRNSFNKANPKASLKMFKQNETDFENILLYPRVDSNGRLICKYCELKYSTTQTLQYHVKIKHPDKANKKDQVNKMRRRSKYKCHICRQHFKCVAELKDHVNSSHSLELIKLSCIYCKALFCTNIDLQNHMYSNHNIKKFCLFMCELCGYKTAKKSHYNQHLNIHTNNNKIQCQYCDYATNHLPNFKTHKQVHSNFKPYVCEVKDCVYKSASKSALRSHELKHNTDKNMLICDQCNYVTAYKQTLKKHLSSHSRNTVIEKT